MIAAAAVLLMVCSAPVLAWFTASAAVSGRVVTGTWTDGLTFSPGCSKAVQWSSRTRSRLLPIATRAADGGLSLDFGDLKAPGCAWTDVFRISSTADEPVQVSYVVTGAIASFMSSVRFADGTSDGVLAPHQTRLVAVVLGVPSRTPPGEYRGTLTVGAIGSAETHAMPMLVTVMGAHRPTPPPTTKPSPTGSPSCSPSPSGSPTCTPSASPSPEAPVLYELGPGLSTVLPEPGATSSPVAVAQNQPDGTLTLDFFRLPIGAASCFSDVLRIAGVANDKPKVTLSLEDASGDLFARAGIWDAKQQRLRDDVTLEYGVTESVAVQFEAPVSATLGARWAILVVTATTRDGRRQEVRLPVTVDFQNGGPSPFASPSPSQSPEVAPSVPSSPAPSTSPCVTPLAGAPDAQAWLSLFPILALPAS